MKKFLAISAVLLTCLSTLSLNAKAQTGIPTPLIGNYVQQRDDVNFHKYIDGAFDGLSTYSFVVQQRGQQKPAFCLPAGVDTSIKLALEIIDGYIQANPLKSAADGNAPTLLVLFSGLENKYPCK